MFTILLFILFVTLVIEFARRRRNNFQYFKNRGIPGPPPHFLWGHYLELRGNHMKFIEKCHRDYGNSFGIFWGDRPHLVTCDLELEKQVLLKDFPNFANRSMQFALEDLHPIAKHMILIANGPTWKKLRNAITPAFSASKLKDMEPLIHTGINRFRLNLAKEKSSFDVYPILKMLTVDIIGLTVFGIDANTQNNTEIESPILKAALRAVNESTTGTLNLLCNGISLFNQIFGNLLYLALVTNVARPSVSDICDEMEKIIAARKKAPRRKDLLQSLLDVQEINIDSANGVEKKTQKLQLTTDEIVGTSITMFLAGYETSSTAMAFILHCLGKHPEVQEKLREEIVEALDGKAPSYEIAMNLKYMDRVIKEVLRLYPPVTNFTTRTAAKEMEINGMKITKGLNLCFPTKLIHRSENFWDEPTVFNPDRFLTEPINPLAYQPFGDGQRNCVGMRMALFLIKMMLCKIIPNFRIRAERDEPVIKCVNVISQPVELMISVEEI